MPNSPVPVTPPSLTLSVDRTPGASDAVLEPEALSPASSLPASFGVDDTASSAAINSPLFASLQHVVADPSALSPDMINSIPLQNNPRPMRALMNDAADYWIDINNNLACFKFPAQVDRNGLYGRIGPYFNLPSTGLDITALQKTRAQFELVALQETDPECPEEAIACSSILFDTLCVLLNEAESVRSNANMDRKQPLPFWRTYLPDQGNHYAFVVTTEQLFRDLPSTNKMPTPRMSRADIGKSGGPMSPSKVRATSAAASPSIATGMRNTTAGSVVNATRGKAENTRALHISDLPDPYGRYAGLLRSNPELSTVNVVIPDIRDRHGLLITPGEYDSKIQDGDYVEVEVFLKLWDIRSNNRIDSTPSRIYQIMLRSMKLLPYHTYSQANILRAGSPGPSDDVPHAPDIPDVPSVPGAASGLDSSDVPGTSTTVPADINKGKGKTLAKGRNRPTAKGKGRAVTSGKRKAVDEEQLGGQSPSKKSLVVEEGNDWVMAETND